MLLAGRNRVLDRYPRLDAGVDNIPVVSYFVLRGRCRTCGEKIGAVYPAVELVSAFLVVACVLEFGLTFEAAIAAFFCCVLVAISAVDLAHRIVPDRIVLPATAIVLVAQTIREPSLEWLLAAFLGALFLFLAVLVYPAGMGMGDVKLALLMGAALGKLVAVALMVGMVAALVPIVTLSTLLFGQLLAGAVLTEQVFTIPGFGKLIVDAVFNRDYGVVQGVVLCTAITFILMNLIADVLYIVINPRLRTA